MDHRIKTTIISVIVATLLPVANALAYSVETHAFLSSETLEFYNRHFPDQEVPKEHFNYFIDGARREDDVPRWMNHFYDPVHNRGLTHDPAIDPLIDVGGPWNKSKDWAVAEDAQNEGKYKVTATVSSILSAIEARELGLISTETNFVWQKALRHYVRGDIEKAMFILGHVVHLVQDASVPDHTRNDPHPSTDDGGSPYEGWTAQFSLTNPDSKLKDMLDSKRPITKESLEAFFDELATYSNNNFYSKDTIGLQSGYQLPQYDYIERDGKFFYAFNESSEGDYRIAVLKRFNGGLIFQKNKDIGLQEKGEDKVVQDYWQRLAPKAVQYGAGVIHLFFEEAERVKSDPNFVSDEPKGFFGMALDTAKYTVGTVANSLSGAFNKSINIVQNFKRGEAVSEDTAGIMPDSEPKPQSNKKSLLDVVLLASDMPASMETSKDIQAPVSTDLDKQELSGTTKIKPEITLDENQLNEKPEIETTSDNPEVEDFIEPILGKVLGVANISSFVKTTEDRPTFGGGAPVIFTPTPSTQPAPIEQSSSEPIYENESEGDTQETQQASGQETGQETEGKSTDDGEGDNADHVVISEILFDASGADGGKEFVELYNPSDAPVDTDTWKLVIFKAEEGIGNALSLAKIGGKAEDETIIPSHGFLLIGLNNYKSENWNDVSPDVLRSASLPNGGSISEPQLMHVSVLDDNYLEIDSVSYSSHTLAESGGSLERRAWTKDNGCIPAFGEGEYLGNGCDRDISEDFITREKPNPQNTASAPEPRPAPDISNFEASFDKSSLSVKFEWAGTVPDLGYKLVEVIGGGEDITLYEGVDSNFSLRVYDIGRAYNFKLYAYENEALVGSRSVEIAVPSFVDEAYIYPDPRVGREDNYILDIRYSERPFIPKIWSSTEDLWQGMVFYLNRDPNTANIFLTGTDDQRPEDISGVLKTGDELNPAVVFGLNPQKCRASGGTGIVVNCFYLSEEDNRLVFSVSPPDDIDEFSPEDRFTIGYYDWDFGPRGPLRIVARDLTKYKVLNESPGESPPNTPANIEVGFDRFNSRIRLSWPRVTDPDSPDGSIRYEAHATRASGGDERNWISVDKVSGLEGPHVTFTVEHPNSYIFGVRAIDMLGNVSDSAIIEWGFPEGFFPYIKSESYFDVWQDFKVDAGGVLESIDVFTTEGKMQARFDTVFLCTVSIFDITDGSPVHLGSNDGEVRGWNCPGERAFTFHDADIELLPERQYRWRYSFNDKKGLASVKFYGKDTNTASGLFSKPDFQNAIFVLNGQNGELLNNR